jgi:2-polyprenyl-6-methoxyphenol hydroxylase-like FAD-dependent oxidoreductase
MTRHAAPILVVGAGPTGLTVASELTRHGAPVRIIDKLPGIVATCRATGIHSRTLEIFHDLGIVDEVLARGDELRGANQFANGERFLHLRFENEVDSPYPFTISLEQFTTEAILEGLLNRLGGEVERSTELVEMADRLDGVQTTLRHADGSEEIVDTPWLVACDGAHSRVRHLNRQHFPGESDPRQYVVADVLLHEAQLARDEIHAFLTDRGTLFVFPIPRGRYLVIADVRDPRGADTPLLEEIQALVTERGPGGIRVSEPHWLSYFHINYRVTRHYRHGRTLLAGDAAHVHSPVGGLGMNTGIQDAYNLGWKLALVVRGLAPPSLLETYERERRAVAEDVIKVTRMMTEHLEVFRDLPPAERERLYAHTFIPEAERWRSARQREELDLDYRKSPICCEHHPRSTPPRFADGPHSGAQARDAGPLEVGGRTITLFDLLRGPRHTLLLFADGASAQRRSDLPTTLADSVACSYAHLIDVYLIRPTDGAARLDAPHGVTVVGDPERALQRRYGAAIGCTYLIRPNGYVGYRSPSLTLPRLRQYLDRVRSRPQPASTPHQPIEAVKSTAE